MHDVVIVGAGAAGAWAAHELAAQRRSVLLLDVGFRATDAPPLSTPFSDLRRGRGRDGHDLLGNRFETLSNVVGPYQSPKLNAPRFRFVTRDAELLAPIRSGAATITQSFAYGGLANAWGAGAYRFTSDDLRHFPLPPGALDPYYDSLTRAIGISGTRDDLDAHFGGADGLQAPLTLDRLASHALAGYERRREAFRDAGFTLGRTRLAVLTAPLDGRPACAYDNLTFWEPRLPYVYVPTLTLDGLIAQGAIDYVAGRLALRFRETATGVEVTARNLATGQQEQYVASRLVLAAGALNSARLALQSSNDLATRLPVLDNLPSMVPFIAPHFIGAPLDQAAHGLGQLNVVFREGPASDYLQGTFYSYTSLLAGEVIMDFPLPVRGAVTASRYLLPGLSVVTFFYPASPDTRNHVRLDGDGALAVTYEAAPSTGAAERRFAALMRRCGFWSHPALFRVSPRGAGIHYAGTLPMRATADRPYTTDIAGRLHGHEKVFVADAAVFPFLPAKNHTFTVMANAMRTAREVAASLQRS